MKQLYKTVYDWFSKVQLDRGSINDEFREGWPKSVEIPNTIDVLRNMSEEDRQVIETSIRISQIAIHLIIHEHFAVKNICSRWIPHKLTEDQKTGSKNWCRKFV